MWLPKLRAMPGMAGTPAIAVTGYASEIDRATSLAVGFEKHLIKPASLIDIITAITILTSRRGPLALKPMLANLGKVTGCRYTSFMRFDHDTLVSVWTYDRANEGSDAFPLQTAIEASYCILVKQAEEMIVIENAAEDPRAVGHPKQHMLSTYAGAPVYGADGNMIGTLCSYDEAPKAIGVEATSALSDAARQLEVVIQAAAEPVLLDVAPCAQDLRTSSSERDSP